MFGRQNEQKLTYKVDLDTQGMQQQMQQMQFQQQNMMAGPMMGGGMNPYANQESLRNFAMAQEAQQMANMDYASMTFRERAGLALTRTLTQGMAIAGGALAVGTTMIEAPILPFTGDAMIIGGEMATGKNFYPSAIIGAATANMIEGTVSGAAEAFRYKHALNIAEGHNLLGGSASSSFKNNLSIYAGDLASYHNLNPNQMTSVLTAAIDNDLVNPQDLEQTKENVFKLTRSLTASTKVLYESLAMVDKTIQDFKQYSIFNSKPESMVETATFLKSISNLTGHSVDQLLQTTESLSNAFISGTALNAGTMAPIIARGIGNAYVGMDMLNDRSQQLIRNSGGIDSLHGRFLAQAQQAGVNNPAIFSHLVGLHQYASGGSWEEGMQSAQDRMVAEYGRGNAVGASYVRESMAKMLADPAAMSQMIHADVTRNYTNLIQSGRLTYQEAFSLSMQNNLGIDAGTSEAYSDVLMRATSSRVEHENALQSRMARNAEIKAANYKRGGGGAMELGRSFGRWAADFFMGDPNDKSAWFGTHKVPELSFKDITEEDQKNLVRMYRLDDQLAAKLEGKDKREYEENLTLLMSSKISDILLGAENMGDFFLSKGLSLGEVEDPSAVVEEQQRRYAAAQKIGDVFNTGDSNLSKTEIDQIAGITGAWVKKYFGSGEESRYDREEKYKALEKELIGAGYKLEDIAPRIQALKDSEGEWAASSTNKPFAGALAGNPSNTYGYIDGKKAADAKKVIRETNEKIATTQIARMMDYVSTPEYTIKDLSLTQQREGMNLDRVRIGNELKRVGVSEERLTEFYRTGTTTLTPEEYASIDSSDKKLFGLFELRSTSLRSELDRKTFINLNEVQAGRAAVDEFAKFSITALNESLSTKYQERYKDIFGLVQKYRTTEEGSEKDELALQIAESMQGLSAGDREVLTDRLGLDVDSFEALANVRKAMNAVGTEEFKDYTAAAGAVQKAMRSLAERMAPGTQVTLNNGKKVDIMEILDNPEKYAEQGGMENVTEFIKEEWGGYFEKTAQEELLRTREDEQKKLEGGTSSVIEDSFESLGKTLPDVADGFVRLAESMDKPWWREALGL